MGKAFQTKMDDVVWEYNDEHLKAWKEGRTGYPMVDAGQLPSFVLYFELGHCADMTN